MPRRGGPRLKGPRMGGGVAIVQECIVCCRHAKVVVQCLTQAGKGSVTSKCMGTLGGLTLV